MVKEISKISNFLLRVEIEVRIAPFYILVRNLTENNLEVERVHFRISKPLSVSMSTRPEDELALLNRPQKISYLKSYLRYLRAFQCGSNTSKSNKKNPRIYTRIAKPYTGRVFYTKCILNPVFCLPTVLQLVYPTPKISDVRAFNTHFG